MAARRALCNVAVFHSHFALPMRRRLAALCSPYSFIAHYFLAVFAASHLLRICRCMCTALRPLPSRPSILFYFYYLQFSSLVFILLSLGRQLLYVHSLQITLSFTTRVAANAAKSRVAPLHAFIRCKLWRVHVTVAPSILLLLKLIICNATTATSESIATLV